MDFALKMKALFIGILIFLIYLFVFAILHGKKGMLEWAIVTFVIALVIGAILE